MEFATGALGTLLPKLGQLLQDEYYLQKSAKKNIKSLTKELESIHAALRKVGEVPLEQLDEQVRIWAREAREVSYDMEDIVDTFLVRVQGPERPSKRSAKSFVKEMMGFVTKAKARREIGQEIKDIKERVQAMSERRDRYNLLHSITPAKAFDDVDPRIEFLYAKAADLVGVEGSTEELITKLSKGDDTSLLQPRIVSVVGFGGLGKTTLARAVKDKLKGQFNCTAFVPVGRNPDLKKVLKDILIDLDRQRYMHFNFAILDVAQLIDTLKEFLENKRYFIVIDDVWEKESWKIIKLALLENKSGSRIIITTRIHEVAREAGEVYKLKPLSDENSRKLFFARIFGGDIKSSDHQPDDEVSDKILKKCEGIPLAIITMASLLVGKPREEWSEVNCSIGFSNNENEQVETINKILSYSYYDLPSHLKTCLLYLSMFPEDYFIEKDPLIWMWIAEGFVDKKQGRSSFKIGEGYFNQLVNRSLIQLVEEGEGYRMVYGCHVHDMVLDLIRSISSEENFVTLSLGNNEGATTSSQGRVRRLALQNTRTVEAHHMEDLRQVRSFISWGHDIDKGVRLASFKLTRVLAIQINSHLGHLRDLLHLRYLQLSDVGSYVELPEEIGTLKFLQTLVVYGILKEEVVTSMLLLTQLLCMRIRYFSVTVFPDGIRKLTSLEELEICFGYYGRSEEEALGRFMKELGSLRELRVLRFAIFHKMSTEVQINLVESLLNLRKMTHLSLNFSPHSQVSVDTAAWEAAGFLLPRSIQKLFIGWAIFSRFPSSCINPSSLPILSHLSLDVDAINEQDLRILGRLPQLRDLELEVESTLLEVPCNTSTSDDDKSLELNVSTTDPAGGDGYLFQKLRRCRLFYYKGIRLLQSGVSFRLQRVYASVVLSSEWEGVYSVIGLMAHAQELEFAVWSVREFKDGSDGNGCGSFALEYFASLQKVMVNIYCNGSSAAEVEEVEAALRRAAELHPNRPTLEMDRQNEDEMISAAQDQEVIQQAGTSEGN